VAYVGTAGNLRQRVIQHFVNRDTSVATGTSATGLNVDAVSHLEWWEHARFSEAMERQAAELVAFDVLDPVLRSRGNHPSPAKELYVEAAFVVEMRALFEIPPTCRLVLPRLSDVAQRVREIDERLRTLEQPVNDALSSGS
jgi:hypothetical protein